MDTTFEIRYKQYGWICPRCGRVNAPYVSTCPCYKQPDPNTNVYFNNADFWSHTTTNCHNDFKYDDYKPKKK